MENKIDLQLADTLQELRDAKEHLEEMSEITRHIGYNDIQMFTKKAKGGMNKKIEEGENSINVKEIQD